jgi:hypothetical protein
LSRQQLLLEKEAIAWGYATSRQSQPGSYNCPNAVTHIMKIGGVALITADDLVVGQWLAPLAPLEL